MSPDRAFTVLLRRFALLLLAHALLGAGIGAALAYASTPVYTSHASTLVAADTDSGRHGVSSATNIITGIMPTIVQLSTSDSVLEEVSKSTGIGKPEVKRAISVSASTNSLIINISATTTSAESAHAIVEAEVKALRNVVADLTVKPQEETALALTEIDAASLPTEPSGPSTTRYTLYGGMAGLAIGIAVTLAILRMRSTDRDNPATVDNGAPERRIAPRDENADPSAE